jgi:hypothetical protein
MAMHYPPPTTTTTHKHTNTPRVSSSTPLHHAHAQQLAHAPRHPPRQHNVHALCPELVYDAGALRVSSTAALPGPLPPPPHTHTHIYTLPRHQQQHTPAPCPCAAPAACGPAQAHSECLQPRPCQVHCCRAWSPTRPAAARECRSRRRSQCARYPAHAVANTAEHAFASPYLLNDSDRSPRESCKYHIAPGKGDCCSTCKPARDRRRPTQSIWALRSSLAGEGSHNHEARRANLRGCRCLHPGHRTRLLLVPGQCFSSCRASTTLCWQTLTALQCTNMGCPDARAGASSRQIARMPLLLLGVP